MRKKWPNVPFVRDAFVAVAAMYDRPARLNSGAAASTSGLDPGPSTPSMDAFDPNDWAIVDACDGSNWSSPSTT